MKKFIAVWLTGIIFSLAVWGGIICVAAHFIKKFW